MPEREPEGLRGPQDDDLAGALSPEALEQERRVEDLLAEVRSKQAIVGGALSTLASQRYLEQTGGEITPPWPDLARAIGPIAPGWLTVIGARPGNGKTALLLNWMDHLHDTGTGRTMYIGTELDPAGLYLQWAALRLGYPPDAVFQRQWHLLPFGAKDQLAQMIDAMGKKQEAARTWFPPCSSPTVADVRALLNTAGEEGYSTVFFDHLHRIRPDTYRDDRSALQDAVRSMAEAAVEHKLHVICAAQLRREEAGVFERYRPPHMGSFMGSSAIEQNAVIALGVFRLLRRTTLKEEREIRNGTLSIADFTLPNVMGVKVLKHRFNGAAFDRLVQLRIDAHGRVGNLQRETLL